LENKTPQEILVWAIDHLDGLYQTTAFGLWVTFSSFDIEASERDWLMSRTGTAALDMISKISLDREETHLVPLVS
jgi:phosphoadenosine phosphosulfate reductase